jgi:hypothetical protein
MQDKKVGDILKEISIIIQSVTDRGETASDEMAEIIYKLSKNKSERKSKI